MRKIDSLKALAVIRLVSAIAITMLTITGMLFTDSFYGCVSVLLIGSSLLVLVDNHLNK